MYRVDQIHKNKTTNTSIEMEHPEFELFAAVEVNIYLKILNIRLVLPNY